MKRLDLTKNKLKNLSGLKNLPELTDLTVSLNKKLKEFGDISDMPKLNRLIMKGCRIKVFGDKLPELPSLTHIDLSENKLATLAEVKKMV